MTAIYALIIVWYFLYRSAMVHTEARVSQEISRLEDTGEAVSMADQKVLLYLEAYNLFTRARFDLSPASADQYFSIDVEYVTEADKVDGGGTET